MDAGKSELLNSLETYLNNKARLQPIIGLGTIIECVNVTSWVRETLYLCEVCACRLTKADMRNHIMGSHHRFNYIKARHPHLVSEWLGSPDRSKMAWPLMELAKVLEKKEGPGNVQLFEVQDELYKLMATQSENHAVTLMKTLKQEQAELESFSETKPLHYPVASQRVVLPAHKQWEHPETSDKGDMKLGQVSQQTELKKPLQNISAPQLEKVQMSAESESGDGFLEDFPGATPVVGLVRVVEFRSEDGCSSCFLCHCCRIRATKDDLIDHLTCSSHLVNYLMEIYPDHIQALGKVSEDDFQLQSLAAKVEVQEGRGEMKIVNVPESICSQLTGKSYHWCLKMLSRGGEHSNLQQKRKAVIGVNKITAQHAPEKSFVVMSKRAKRMKPMRKKSKKTNTMFNVSLPIGEGEFLLERRSFDTDNLFESSASPSSSPSEILETRSPTDSSVDVIDIQLELQTSQLEQELYQEDEDPGDYMSEKHIRVTVFQGEDGYAGDNMPGLSTLRGSQECSRKDWIEDLQAQNGGPFPAGAHSEECSPFNSYYRDGSCGTDIWYSSASAGAEWEASSLERESNEIISSYGQQHQNQQPSWSVAGFHTGRVWEQQIPYFKDARINVETHSGDIPVYRDNFLLDPRGQVPETDQRQAQTYSKFTTDHHQTAPHSYTPPSTALEVSPIQKRLMFQACHDATFGTTQGPLPRTSQGPLPRTSQGPLPRTSQGPLPHTSQGPLLRTSQGPLLRTSQGPLPRTSQRPLPRTSQRPLPRTSQRPLPRTSQEPLPRTRQGPLLCTSQVPLPRTSQEPLPRTRQGPLLCTSQRPLPRTSQGPLPRTSQGPLPRTSQGPLHRTSQGPLPQARQGPLPHTNPNFMYPITDGAGWGWTQADAFIQPGQSACYTPSPDVYFSAGIPN